MRDKIKDSNYFIDFIKQEEQRIEKFTNNLEMGLVAERQIIPVKMKVNDLKTGVLIAKYSQGVDVQNLAIEFKSIIEEWCSVFSPKSYNKMLQMISLGILLGIDDDVAAQVNKLLRDNNVNDWLLDYLMNGWLKKDCEPTSDLLFSKRFSTLKSFASSKNDEELKTFLSKWYNKDCGCYEAHKEKQMLYYGYWSFEAGAISKMLGIDDTSFKDVQYYPYDLVHYQK